MSDRIDFEQIEREERRQAKRIAEYFRDLSWTLTDDDEETDDVNRPTRILDVGCGPGLYVEELRAVGFDAWGVDNDTRAQGEPYLFLGDVVHMAKNNATFGPADIVLSLEVGEHMPQEDASPYVCFIAGTNARIVYFSAARPGQGGVGHINCQPKNYWSRLFALNGFYLDSEETESWLSFMRNGPHMGWLAHPELGNGMVFQRATP